MSQFKSPIGGDLAAFLQFKRNQGYRYLGAELTLKNFDRFISREIRKSKKRFRLDEAALTWIEGFPNRKPCSLAHEVSIIRQFWDFLKRRYPNRYKREIYWPRLASKSNFRPYVFSKTEIRLLLKHIDRWKPSSHRVLMRTVFLVLYCTGLRFGEVARLRNRDVDLRRQVFFISESKGRSRWVPFHPSLERELRRYFRLRQSWRPDQNSDAPFFLRDRSLPLSVNWLSKWLRSLFRQIGFKPARGRVGPRPYDLRHTFAVHRLTLWYKHGVDFHARLPWLSAYMGHVNLIGTETYLTATPELLALTASRFKRRYENGKRSL
jgi:integrase/recombinase XerD